MWDSLIPALALVLVMPLLVIYSDMLGILGGAAVGMGLGLARLGPPEHLGQGGPQGPDADGRGTGGPHVYRSVHMTI